MSRHCTGCGTLLMLHVHGEHDRCGMCRTADALFGWKLLAEKAEAALEEALDIIEERWREPSNADWRAMADFLDKYRPGWRGGGEE